MDFIKWLQGRLTAHGRPLVVNRDWGRVSIEELKAFQRAHGIAVTGVADRKTIDALSRDPDASGNIHVAPRETMPPWMAELHRRMGLHEVRDNAALTAFLKVGRWLGNPRDLPWCGDAVESVIAKTLPQEALPANPFLAQAWASFGTDVAQPIFGAIGVIRWSASTGHVALSPASTAPQSTSWAATRPTRSTSPAFPGRSS
ncbi:MAG: peptidoglycan-binding protein [Rhizobium sp.]|nr:peptidoglycan-binding protein [Rhizobium sp.]